MLKMMTVIKTSTARTPTINQISTRRNHYEPTRDAHEQLSWHSVSDCASHQMATEGHSGNHGSEPPPSVRETPAPRRNVEEGPSSLQLPGRGEITHPSAGSQTVPAHIPHGGSKSTSQLGAPISGYMTPAL